jgi:hypothetical protein
MGAPRNVCTATESMGPPQEKAHVTIRKSWGFRNIAKHCMAAARRKNKAIDIGEKGRKRSSYKYLLYTPLVTAYRVYASIWHRSLDQILSNQRRQFRNRFIDIFS